MSEWITLIELREGAIFTTESGCIAVKSEYFYGNERDSQCQCVLVETGEYAHFLNGNKQLVKEIDLAQPDAALQDPFESNAAIADLLERLMVTTTDKATRDAILPGLAAIPDAVKMKRERVAALEKVAAAVREFNPDKWGHEYWYEVVIPIGKTLNELDALARSEQEKQP